MAPLIELFYKAFNYNKYLAGAGFAGFITLALFFLMVALISLGDATIKTDNSRKLGDVIMPERDIDTLFDNDLKSLYTKLLFFYIILSCYCIIFYVPSFHVFYYRARNTIIDFDLAMEYVLFLSCS